LGIRKGQDVNFNGAKEQRNISAIATWGQHAFIASDEATQSHGNCLQRFDSSGEHFTAAPSGMVELDVPEARVEDGEDTLPEMDLEGLAVEGNSLYAIGSHSAKRKSVSAVDNTREKNRRRLTSAAKKQPYRDCLLKIELNDDGTQQSISRTSLADYLDATEPFKTHRSVAGKENGVDIEGLAVKDGSLFVGFRGPVLRGNYVPIVRCKFGDPPAEHEILFVNLEGRGVRDLITVENGLLILAGPVGDGSETYRLYYWNGEDQVPGTDVEVTDQDSGLISLGDLPMPETRGSLKAEGIALVTETTQTWELIIMFDGDSGGARYSVDVV
jgi:hypothetical protein